MTELTKEDLIRQTIDEEVARLETDELYRIDELVEKHGQGLTLFVETDYWYDDCTVTIKLCTHRLETDEEYTSRLERLKVYRAKQAATAEKRRKTREAKKHAKLSEERKLYEQLKAKFEGEG